MVIKTEREQEEIMLMENIEKIGTPEEDTIEFSTEVNYASDEVNFGHENNEVGLAQRLIDMYDGDIRFVQGLNAWIVWNGSVWQEDGTKIYMKRRVINMLNQMKKDADDIDDEGVRKTFMKFIVASGTANKINNIIDIAQAGKGIMIEPSQLNTNHSLLNCSNGTVNLRTGKLQQHRREDFITKKLDIPYDPDVPCPVWEKFVHEIMCGNINLVEFLQKAFGYSTTGEVTEQCLFFFYGKGKNGKSTILNVLKSILPAFPPTHNDPGGSTPRRE